MACVLPTWRRQFIIPLIISTAKAFSLPIAHALVSSARSQPSRRQTSLLSSRRSFLTSLSPLLLPLAAFGKKPAYDDEASALAAAASSRPAIRSFRDSLDDLRRSNSNRFDGRVSWQEYRVTFGRAVKPLSLALPQLAGVDPDIAEELTQDVRTEGTRRLFPCYATVCVFRSCVAIPPCTTTSSPTVVGAGSDMTSTRPYDLWTAYWWGWMT